MTWEQEPGQGWVPGSLQGQAPSSQFAQLSKDWLLFVYMSVCLSVCKTAKVVCKGQKRVLDHCGRESPDVGPLQAQHSTQTAKPSLQPHFLKVPLSQQCQVRSQSFNGTLRNTDLIHSAPLREETPGNMPKWISALSWINEH